MRADQIDPQEHQEPIDELLRAASKRVTGPTRIVPMRQPRPRVLPAALATLVCLSGAAFVIGNRNQSSTLVVAAPPAASPPKQPGLPKLTKAEPATSKAGTADRNVGPCSEAVILEIMKSTHLRSSGVRRSDLLVSRCKETFAIVDFVTTGVWRRDLLVSNGSSWTPSAHVSTRPRPFVKNPYGPANLDFPKLQNLFGSDFFDTTDPIWKDIGEAEGFKVLQRVLKLSPNLYGFTLYGRDEKLRVLVQLSGPTPKKGSVTADPKNPGSTERWGLVNSDGTYQAITEDQAFDMKSYKSEVSSFSPRINAKGQLTGKWGRLGFGEPSVTG